MKRTVGLCIVLAFAFTLCASTSYCAAYPKHDVKFDAFDISDVNYEPCNAVVDISMGYHEYSAPMVAILPVTVEMRFERMPIPEPAKRVYPYVYRQRFDWRYQGK